MEEVDLDLDPCLDTQHTATPAADAVETATDASAAATDPVFPQHREPPQATNPSQLAPSMVSHPHLHARSREEEGSVGSGAVDTCQGARGEADRCRDAVVVGGLEEGGRGAEESAGVGGATAVGVREDL